MKFIYIIFWEIQSLNLKIIVLDIQRFVKSVYMIQNLDYVKNLELKETIKL